MTGHRIYQLLKIRYLKPYNILSLWLFIPLGKNMGITQVNKKNTVPIGTVKLGYQKLFTDFVCPAGRVF
jgi:hypothetical protein